MFEQPPRHEASNRTSEAIDLFFIPCSWPTHSPKGQPTDVQWNLRQEKEKEQSTRWEPSRFELVDCALEKDKPQRVQSLKSKSSKLLSASESVNLSSHKSHPQFRRPDPSLLAPIAKPPPPNEADNRGRATRKLRIGKNEGRLLEQRIHDIEMGLWSRGASRKDVREIVSGT